MNWSNNVTNLKTAEKLEKKTVKYTPPLKVNRTTYILNYGALAQ